MVKQTIQILQRHFLSRIRYCNIHPVDYAWSKIIDAEFTEWVRNCESYYTIRLYSEWRERILGTYGTKKIQEDYKAHFSIVQFVKFLPPIHPFVYCWTILSIVEDLHFLQSFFNNIQFLALKFVVPVVKCVVLV